LAKEKLTNDRSNKDSWLMED